MIGGDTGRVIDGAGAGITQALPGHYRGITCIFIKTIWTLIKFCRAVGAGTIKKSRYAIASLQMEFYEFCSGCSGRGRTRPHHCQLIKL